MLNVIYGAIAGTVTGLGMGGGTVLILLLSVFNNIDQHVAQATNLIFFIPTSIAAIIVNAKQKNINYKLARIIILFGILGAILGAIIAQHIDSYRLKKYFGFFIILIAFHEIYDLYKLYINKQKNIY